MRTRSDDQPIEAFYQDPDPWVPGEPGTIVRTEPLDGAPAGARAWRVLYHSTSIDGRDVLVSGAVIVPEGPAPAEGRPIVSWAPPTTGVADACAPTYDASVFALVPGLQSMLDAGYVVVATDYEGRGTSGVHPYLVGESGGRSMLDAARAATNLPDTDAGSTLLLWGHSQGGQAALFAGEIAPEYAPDLDVAGVAAAAPAGKLNDLFPLMMDTDAGVILGAFTLHAYMEVYGPGDPSMQISQVVSRDGQAAIPEMIDLCNLAMADEINAIAAPLIGRFFNGNPAATPPWDELMRKNSPGQREIDAPVLIVQGGLDEVVVPRSTDALAQDFCALDVHLQLKTYPTTDHNLIGYTAAGDVVRWMGEVLSGVPSSSTCS